MKNIILIPLCFLVLGCEITEETDITPPQISISAPTNGAILSDTVTIKVLVVDNKGIEKVEFYLNGDLLESLSVEPFEIELDTKQYLNGDYTIQCKAIDVSGNESLSENIQVTIHNALLTVDFTQDWLCPTCGEGILFLSDSSGNLLWEGTWAGNETVEIEPSTQLPELPVRFSITTITQDESGNNVNITTYLNVNLVNWVYVQNPTLPEQVGNVTLNFTNIPDNAGYIISSEGIRRLSISDPLPSTRSIPLLRSIDNIYLRLNTTSPGPTYTWIENVEVNSTYNVNLTNMEPLLEKEISINVTCPDIWIGIDGFLNSEDRYTGMYRLKEIWELDTTIASIIVPYPSESFNHYLTTIYVNDEHYPTNNWRRYKGYGEIPDNLQLIDADFSFVATLPSDFEIDASGYYTSCYSNWTFEGEGKIFTWNVNSANTNTRYSLPRLSGLLTDQYSGINRDVFQLVVAQISDEHGFDNWDEIISTRWTSGMPAWYIFDSQTIRRRSLQ